MVDPGAAGWSVRMPEGYLLGGWRVGAPIATGSWGSVYEAWAVTPVPADRSDRHAAVKLLPTGTVTPRQLSHLADMARREQAAYRALSHPRLLRSIDTIVIDDPAHPDLDGVIALVTELAEESLADVLQRHPGEPVPQAHRLLLDTCEGLAHMHASGWIHGDLKPSNILLLADGSVKLADFGLSAAVDGTHGYLPPIGSTDYMPPERWAEPLTERGTAVRRSTDIWAFGVLACQLLTGHLPFAGTTTHGRATAAAEYAATGSPAPLLDGLEPQWRELIADCLGGCPDHRTDPGPSALPSTGSGGRSRPAAQEVLERLRRLTERPTEPAESGASVEAPQPPAAPAGRPTPASSVPHTGLRRRRTLVIGVAAVLVTGAGVAAAASARGGGSGAVTGDALFLRPRSGIPAAYQNLIIEAGTMCASPGVSPALVAAILKAESDFNPRLSDPAKDEYGIARWTPRVLWHYLDPPEPDLSTRSALTPSLAIPAVGRFLCQFAPSLASVPGDHAVNLAAAYETADYVVRQYGGVPPQLRGYADAVRQALAQYQPVGDGGSGR